MARRRKRSGAVWGSSRSSTGVLQLVSNVNSFLELYGWVGRTQADVSALRPIESVARKTVSHALPTEVLLCRKMFLLSSGRFASLQLLVLQFTHISSANASFSFSVCACVCRHLCIIMRQNIVDQFGPFHPFGFSASYVGKDENCTTKLSSNDQLLVG